MQGKHGAADALRLLKRVDLPMPFRRAARKDATLAVHAIRARWWRLLPVRAMLGRRSCEIWTRQGERDESCAIPAIAASGAAVDDGPAMKASARAGRQG
jgi:hypothetical protein